MQTALGILGNAKVVQVMNWDDERYRHIFKEGYDVSDLIRDDGHLPALEYLEERLKEVPVDPSAVEQEEPPLSREDTLFAIQSGALPDNWRTLERDELQQVFRQTLDQLGVSPTRANKNGPFRIELVDFDDDESQDADTLIDGVLYDKQPLVIAGVEKSLKTTIAVDLCLSLATGADFLGHFPVLEQRRCLFFSLESGASKLRETRQRILSARNIESAAASDFLLSVQQDFHITKQSNVKDLQRQINSLCPDIVIIDPAYLVLDLSGKEASIFGVGAMLSMFVEICGDALPVVIHHTNNALGLDALPQLRHIAYSGLQQWTRQWMLLNRRDVYQSDGRHSLILNVGGSRGHSNQWQLSIDEGLTDNRLTGWEVEIERYVSSQEKLKQGLRATRIEKLVDDVRQFPTSTQTQRKERLQMSGETYATTKQQAIGEGVLVAGEKPGQLVLAGTGT